ncbi:MAG: hypothetical protein KAI02_08365 [Gammaproteobacteria bacterium]|nr:hypothetical protein [Gammaproteobacteria bacterium]
MKLNTVFVAGLFLLLGNNSFAEHFCLSDQSKPTHCVKGDIILIQPTLVPRTCDFDAEILRMPKTDKTAEYLCRYTGVILDIKELKNRRRPAPMNPNNGMRPPPKKQSNNPFDSMPFFK